MHVTYLTGQSSPLAASSASPFHPRSGEPSSLRLARLAADLRNGIIQHPPSVPSRKSCTEYRRPSTPLAASSSST